MSDDDAAVLRVLTCRMMMGGDGETSPDPCVTVCLPVPVCLLVCPCASL